MSKENKKKTDIEFVCYRYTFTGSQIKPIRETTTLFLFYIDGLWDEDKLTIEQALKKYPIEKYNWLVLEQ